MANPKIEATLTELLNGELRAHHSYLQAAAWAAARDLDGCYRFLLKHAAEEMEHMHKLFRYMNDIGATVTFGALPAPQIMANDAKGLFTLVAEQEMAVTHAYDRAAELARAENDHATLSFLQWFVDEQHEENTLCRAVLAKINLIGDGPNALYLIDREIGKFADKHE